MDQFIRLIHYEIAVTMVELRLSIKQGSQFESDQSHSNFKFFNEMIQFNTRDWYFHGPMIAAWVVYKFQQVIFKTGEVGPLQNNGQYGAEYTTMNEARYKTYKNVQNDFPDSDWEIKDGEDEGGKYFAIIAAKNVFVGVLKFIFVPFDLSGNGER